jgi:hypothetical protein
VVSHLDLPSTSPSITRDRIQLASTSQKNY